MRQPKGLSVIEHQNQVLAKLYKTLIVVYDKNTNVLKLDNGGWRTAHTKKCINLVLSQYGYYVKQNKGQWYVYRNEALVGLWHNDTWSSQIETAA